MGDVPVTRQLEWSGGLWEAFGVEGQDAQEPGPNHFSQSLVTVEGDELVLRVDRVELPGRTGWTCARARLARPLGYGLYSWEVVSRVDLLDRHAVAGLFVGRFDGSDLRYSERHQRNVCGEIDIEFSRWGEFEGHNAQYLTQPWEHDRRHRFQIGLDGSCSRHDLLWTPERISFASYHGHPSLREVGRRPQITISAWSYRGDLNPQDLGQLAHISLWLHRGEEPAGDGLLELRVRRFRHLGLD